ncbi:hypothetical protein FQA39_LY18769 [Lamprigera yunnana]|nr:hypothetical protein FQA39_LY18769 [Lamprigera yunnana]
MAENARKRQRPTMSSLKRKTLRVDSPSFEEEFNSLIQVLDKSDSEGDFEEYMIFEGELLQHHESDQDEDPEESQITPKDVDSDSFDDEDYVPLSELRGSNFYYGKNRYKRSKDTSNVRVQPTYNRGNRIRRHIRNDKEPDILAAVMLIRIFQRDYYKGFLEFANTYA